MARLLATMVAAAVGLVLTVFTHPALAQKRVALVIGNAAYQHTPKLANPRNDAADMVAALKKHGFVVIEGFDLNKADFDRKVRDFANALTGAEAGVFFYAGHGLQVSGRNFLVPIDAELSTAAALEFEMVRVDVVHRVMEQQTNTNILFLDACRDNPLARNLARSMGTRSSDIGKGLSSIQSGVGTLISFSTQPDNVALDGTGRNSPFAGALVKQLLTSNDDLSAMLISVRNDVMRDTQRKQVPWEHSALTGRFYFGAAAATAEPPKAAPARLSEAAEAWAAAERTTSVTALEAFVARYKDTFYAELARARIAELKGQQAALSKSAPEQTGKRAEPPEQKTGSLAPSGRGRPLSAAEERELKPKDQFKECHECPEMVVVPAGEFQMGSPAGEEGRAGNEEPRRKVTIARPLAVGRFEVTFAQWDACVAAGGCQQKPSDEGWGRGTRPVINVTWDDVATDYLPWLSRKTGKTYRLLTEAEWEYAARSGSTTAYSWGDEIGPGNANCSGCGSPWSGRQTAPVGSFRPNAFGLHDVHGNVWEWVQDCYRDTYANAAPDGTAALELPGCSRVLRGGSWLGAPRVSRSAVRGGYQPDFRFGNGGFRVARPL
jgi:formylglycine-generating enzyme required for sulfatase activity